MQKAEFCIPRVNGKWYGLRAYPQPRIAHVPPHTLVSLEMNASSRGEPIEASKEILMKQCN